MKKFNVLCLVVLIIFALSCESNSTKPEKDKYSGIIEGVDFDRLFAEPEESEIENVYKEWNARTHEMIDITIEDTILGLVGNQVREIHILSHSSSENIKHYGAIMLPSDTLESYPVLFYNHGGDEGVDLNATITLISFSPDMVEISKQYMIVVPSFRSEAIYANETYQSTGDPSPWDRDVDDCINLLTAVQTTYPKSDMLNVYAIGVSRGAGVSMLWAARDERVKKVVDFFGPTCLISDWTREITYNALHGTLEDLPGIEYLDDNIIQPLKNGTLSIEAARHEMIKRSAVYFLEDITPLQVHHGLADNVVPVEQAEILIEKAVDLDLSEEEFEYFLYENAGHDENTLIRGINEMRNFIMAD